MIPKVTQTLKSVFLCILIAGLTGCVGFGFWFEQLDRLSVWQMDRMLDLNSEQEDQLYEISGDYREWLRNHGVPEAETIIRDVRQAWEEGQLLAATRMLEDRFEDWSREALTAMYPRLQPWLDSLTPENLAYWQAYSRDRYADWFDEHESAEAKLEDRTDRLEDWFGDLSDAQVAMIREHTLWTDADYQRKIDNSEQWREQLSQAILAKDHARLSDWFSNPRALQSESHARWQQAERARFFELAAALYPGLSQTQRDHASARLQEWLDKLAEVER